MKTFKELLEAKNFPDDHLSKFDVKRPAGYPPERDIPVVIVLKRKAIRVFPDNQKIGLYYSQALDKYISIPYGKENKALGMHISEETLEENDVSQLDFSDMDDEYKDLAVRLGGNRKPDKKKYKGTKADLIGAVGARTAVKYKGGTAIKAGEIISKSHGDVARTTGSLAGLAIAKVLSGRKANVARIKADRAKMDAKNAKDRARRAANKAAGVKPKPRVKKIAPPPEQVDEWVGPAVRATRAVGSRMATGAVSAYQRARAALAARKKKSGKPNLGNDKPLPHKPDDDKPNGNSGESAYDAAVRAGERATKKSDYNIGHRDLARVGSSDPTIQSRTGDANAAQSNRRIWAVQKESNLQLVKKMVTENLHQKEFVFGSDVEVIDHAAAKRIMQIYESLNNENRDKFESALDENVTLFRKVINFATRQK